MSVHYKFKSALEYDTVTFDALHISVKDLKNSIIQQKRIGKSTDFDLQVTNAQTKEVYEDENALIPKNTSLLIARIPVSVPKPKHWDGYGGDKSPPIKLDEGGPIAKAVDLSCLDAPEDDKIKAMMSQSTQDYDPSNYMKIRGSNQMGAVPPNYRCYKCHQGGHWIKDCTFGQGTDTMEIKKSTGIPKSFMVPVEGPQVPGAMMTPNGQYAVPLLDHQAYNQKVTPAPAEEPKPEIPEDLICSICSDLLTDAVMIPCCGNSFCDECIRGVLLESEDHECPDCHEKDIFPDTLIPNRFIRTSVSKFKNTTGYVKKHIYREPKYVEPPKVHASTTPPLQLKDGERTIISEADSTESKANEKFHADFPKDTDVNEKLTSAETDSIPEGPPGVSPKNSPRREHIRRLSPSRDSRERSSRHHSSRRDDLSPKMNSHHRRSPLETRAHEERSGTPTIDEPISGSFSTSSYPVPGTVPPVIGQLPPMQVPPQTIPTTYPGPGQPPFAQGPPPNFRLPPPGTAPPPYMAPGPFPIPPRGMYDGPRLPLTGPPPNFNPNFPPSSRSRDFNRRIRDRTPPGVIDDPLAAFNRMLREKDEQKRRAKRFRRSYSRSRSRSRSYSRSPVRRRSRSPRSFRRSKSRSRSFSLSRSRSRSYSGSRRGSPYRPVSPRRVLSPPSGPLVRRGASRYRSSPPISSRPSPPRTRHPNDRHRDSRDYEDDRDFPRDDRYKDNRRDRNARDVRSREKERDRERDRYYDERSQPARSQMPPAQSWGPQPRPVPDPYYPPNVLHGYQSNRFPPGHGRDYMGPGYNPQYPQPPVHNIQPVRQFQDIRPPGVDEELVPPGVDEPPPKLMEPQKPKKEENDKPTEKRSSDRRDRDKSDDRKRRHERRSRTPETKRNKSPRKRSRSRASETPDRHRRRRRDSSDERDKKRDYSDDERYRKSKDKKRHRDKKDSEKKKKRDKKEKHKKDGKEKKHKDEFKQVFPRKSNEDSDECDERERKSKHVDEVPKRAEDVTKSDKVEEKAKNEEKPAKKEKDKSEVVTKEPKVSKRSVVVDKRPDIKEKMKLKLKPKEKVEEKPEEKEQPKADLYQDIISEEKIDKDVVQTYGKLEEESQEAEDATGNEQVEAEEEGEIKDLDDEEKDILELHTNDIDLKAELEKNDILAPVPEKSKWEVDDDLQSSPKDSNRGDSKTDKSGKVTNEVLKRAENAIFAKAINAIRPIEIKKISNDRAKLYSGEQEEEATVVVPSVVDVKKEVQPPPRLSVKDRLGVKVEDTDMITISDRMRSGTISPFSRRGVSGRNYGLGEKRMDVDDYRSRDRNSSRSRRVDTAHEHRRSDERHHSRTEQRRDVRREEKKHDEKKIKRKRSATPTEAMDKKERHKKKEKKIKKDKFKKGKEDHDKSNKEQKEVKPAVTTKRKPTIDEASFEPDYDLESHTEEEDERDKKSKKYSEEEEKSSSSESESESSSDDDRKKKKHKKHKKRKKRDSSSSSSSESESDSSDSEKEKRRKKHRKSKKKKKKSKHK